MWPKKINYKTANGFSLIELMVATTIGITVSILTINYLSFSMKSRDLNAAFATLKDNGAVGLYFLAKYTRSAGLKTIPIMGDTAKTHGACTPNTDFCTMNSNTSSDRIAIRKIYPENTIACNGQPVDGLAEIVEVFSVFDFNDYTALVCQSYSLATNQWLGSDHKRVLQTGIDDFQVQYYEQGMPAPVNADNVLNWGAVQGIEIALLANSEVSAYSSPIEQYFSVLDRAEQEFVATVERQIFQTSIAFNNTQAILND